MKTLSQIASELSRGILYSCLFKREREQKKEVVGVGLLDRLGLFEVKISRGGGSFLRYKL